MSNEVKPDSPRRLREEILTDAQHQSEAIVQRARQEVETMLAKTQQEAKEIQRQILSEARAEGERRAGLVLATVPVEAGRLRSDAVERLLESILQEARQRLCSQAGFDSRKAIVSLAIEAVRQMAGERFVVGVSVQDDTALGKGLAEEIACGAGRAPSDVSITGDPTIKGGGVVVRDPAGRQIWDNQFGTRLDRLWPELRREVATQTGIMALGGTPGGAP